MPFVQIAPKRFGGFQGIGQTKVTMGAYLSEGPKKPRQIVLRIPKAIIEEAGFVVSDRRTLIGLHEGVGDDTGFLMLYYTEDSRRGSSATQSIQTSRHPNGEDIESEQGYAVAFRFERFQYYAPNEWPTSSTQVNHIIDNGNLIIECPEWFRPNVEKMKAEGLWKEEKTEPPPPKIKELEVKVPDVKLNRQERRAIGHKIARHLR